MISLNGSGKFPVIVLMKALLPLAGLLAISFASVHAKEPSEKLADLRQEKREIDKKIREAVPDPGERDPELAKLQRASVEASKAHQQAINDHPNLQKYKTEMTAATAKLTTAISKKDEARREAAKNEISDIMNRRAEAAAREPDLQLLAKADAEAGAAWFKKRKEVLVGLPETKDLAARLETLDARIQEELGSQK